MKKRIIALALVLVMLITALCACTTGNTGNEKDSETQNSEETTGNSNGSVTDSQTKEPSYYETPDDLGTMNLGKTINLLCWEAEQPEFEIEGQTGDSVTDAIYFKNQAVEARLGVTLNFEMTPGNFANRKAFIEKVESGKSNKDYDIVACYSMTSSSLALKGLSEDLLSLDYLNFDKPWWPDSLVSQATINDKLYFASGDISTNLLHMMYATFFNKTMFEEFDELKDIDPYKLVTGKKWTIDRMTQLCSKVSGTTSTGEIKGLSIRDLNYDAFYTSCGLKTIEKADDKLVISEDFKPSSQKTIQLIDKLVNFVSGKYVLAVGSGSSAQPFAENRALFTIDRSYLPIVSKNMIEAGDSIVFGVIPCPMYDTKQDNYVTVVGFPYTMYQITSYSNIKNESSAVLECLAAEGFRRVTPALFEKTMKVKNTSDKNTAEMYDIIKSTVYFDLGRIFAMNFSEWTYKIFRDCLATANNSFSSSYGSNSITIQKALDEEINPYFFGSK